jgi:predicted  nucleic acid-binding Zn ribbon protein
LVEPHKTCNCRRLGPVVFDPVAHPLAPASPLRCRFCAGRVPLFRFRSRQGADREFVRLLSAETIWRGLHWAWVDSAETEALAWNQIADPDSELNRLIRRQVRSFEKQCSIKAYVLLATEYWTQGGMERTVCSGCGRPWVGEEKNKLRCDRCHLITEISDDRHRPAWWRPLPRHRR